MKNRTRLISLLLCLSTLFSTISYSAPTVFAAEKSVKITLDGQQTDSVVIEQENKIVLSAETEGIEAPSFQWQILLDVKNAVWVNIYDKTEQNCEVSYALVKNMLDESDSTYIRCAVRSAEETVFSDAVCVTVIPEQQSALQITDFSQTRYVATENSAPVTFSMTRAADVNDYITITVKYLDIASLGSGTESAIYSPYTATILKGTDFKQSVVSPTFLGFAPYRDTNENGVIDDSDESAATLNLDYASVNENIEIKVYYKPIKVNFAIKYFFQNINDDLYTEDPTRYHTDKTETGTIISNEYLMANAGNTVGFTKMYHIPESVAADGSTVFECYYDRNYYLIQFDLNGGYGVDPIYARYGTPFIVNDPIRHGYTFKGWKLTAIDTNGNGEWDDALPDGVSTSLVSTIPQYNYRYQAQWETVDTTYTVVYWLDDNYLGSRIVSEKSGEYVSGSDDLATARICGIAEHTHSAENGCYGNCTEEEHICSISCYTTTTLTPAAETNDNTVKTVYNDLVKQVGTPTEGNVYKYAYRPNRQTTYYNFFYYGDTWYYLGTGSDYDNITVKNLESPSQDSYNTVAATKNCSATAHTHTDDCLSCENEEHTHDDACEIDTTYFVYETADTNVLVEGDGSTVVNVHYKPKEYTLRFYYAATTGTGTDDNGDGIAETYDSVKIIGGSTYSFGATGTNTSNDETLLNDIFKTDKAGSVTKLPQLNAEGKSRNYTLGTLTSGENTYHYIEFTAGYGQDISELWPCAVFDSATRTDISKNQNGWNGTEAFVSAWNGEHHVYYSQRNANQTIKGNYEKLDYQLLFDPIFTDETTVSYLCFWENGTDSVNWNVPKLFVYRIWVPVLAGEDTTDLTTKTLNGVTYKLIDSYDTCDDSSIYGQTQPALEGYTAIFRDGEDIDLTEEQAKMYEKGYNVNFYYSRANNSFAMKNHGEYLVNNLAVPYLTKLSNLSEVESVLDENFEPEYPSTLEENAYYFEGWYTTEQCIPGTKIDLSSATMPASGLILYANWVPETHTVRFFTTYDEMLSFENNTSSNSYYSAGVRHGEIIGVVETPTRSGDGLLDLTFAGWFYMENGQKKAFSPLNMPINRDINIFAEWSSHSPQPYHISYVLKTNPSVKVADDSTGYAYGGSTRTFNAKAGDPYNQLYSTYNKGYFPTVSSHSITIQAEADKDHPEHNVYTFYYVKADNISYTVRYVNKETNVVMDTETYTTTSAVVTERFKEYPDMVPDAFYKRLVLEVKEDENGNWVGTENNVITFYYTPNTTSAYYAVHFMLEKLNATDTEKSNYAIDGSGGYEETETHIEGVGLIGNTIYITPQEISGFSLINNDSKVPIILSDGEQSVANYSSSDGGYGITITHSGTELYLFYERNDYPYQVHYYEYNTTTSLADSKSGNAPYGSDLTETALDITGYTCVSEKNQTITIREDDDNNGLNVIIFYYAPIQYVAEYVAVPDVGGWLSSTIEVISGTESLSGSLPTANQYYAFVGWYLDEACTQRVSAEYGTVGSDGRFTPNKSKLSETERNIFYAKFTKMAGDFTIDRNGAAEEDQVFVYEIKNDDTGDVIYVTVTGNNSVTVHDLALGNYTVTQQNDWSWRYDDAASVLEHQNPDGTTVTFGKSVQEHKWLNGHSSVVKNVKGEQ